MIRIAGSVSKGWLARQLDVVFDRDYYFDPARRHAIDVRCNEHVRRTLVDLNVFYTEANLGRIEYHGADQVLVGGIQPNMLVGMLMGATFVPTDHADADISPRCMAELDVARLPDPDSLLAHPLVRQFDEQVAAIRADANRRLRPVPPLFWDTSGRAAVHGAMTSGLKFFGDDFLMQMLTDADRCRVVIEWLTDVSASLVAHFSRIGDVPVTRIHVGECASCMIDAANFARFVVPATSRLGRRFGTVRFHSCGRNDHLVEVFPSIEGLAELDVGGETSVARIRQVLGRDFPIGICPLVDHMASGSAEGILEWYRRVRDENDGGDLTIGYHLEAEYNVENLRVLHRAVHRDDEPPCLNHGQPTFGT
ncbi:MAG: hypothetical protein FJ276_23695 [Planctomycetes bacterium]|nr:hypothetical protein [Planctomycetota bacterium]